MQPSKDTGTPERGALLLKTDFDSTLYWLLAWRTVAETRDCQRHSLTVTCCCCTMCLRVLPSLYLWSRWNTWLFNSLWYLWFAKCAPTLVDLTLLSYVCRHVGYTSFKEGCTHECKSSPLYCMQRWQWVVKKNPEVLQQGPCGPSGPMGGGGLWEGCSPPHQNFCELHCKFVQFPDTWEDLLNTWPS